MAVTLQIRRGTKNALTSRGALAAGELGFTTDEKLVYVSDGSANYLIGRVSSGSGTPSGNLVAGTLYIDTATAKLYFCNGSTWVEASPTSITINDSGTGNTDLWSAQKIQTQINAAVDGLDWQESIKDKDLTAPPGSPSEGDRYIVAADPAGAWANKGGQITEYRSASWVFFPPNEGFCCLAEDEDVEYVYNGSTWVSRTSSSNHNSLSSIQGGTSGEYYHLANTDYAALVTNRSETVEDIVGAMVSSNTETGLSITYDDAGGKLNAAVTYGTDANTACQGNDSRLSNARTPTSHTHTSSDISSGIGVKATSFTQATSSPVTLLDPPNGTVITRIVVVVDGAASAGSPTVSVGTAGDADRDMDELDSDIKTAATYIVEPYTACGTGGDNIILTITPDSQTFSGRCYLHYVVPV